MYRHEPFRSFFEEFARSFQPLSQESSDTQSLPAASRWTPAIDAWVEGDRFVLEAYLAGVDPKSVELTATGNRLTIKGNRERRAPKDAKTFSFREVVFGTFERTLELPEGTDASKAEARFEHGVLQVRLPAAGSFVPKKIEIAN